VRRNLGCVSTLSYSRLMQSHHCFATLILLLGAACSELTVAVCVAKPKAQSSENIATLKMQCEQKNYASCFSLGTKYMSGIEVPKDMVQAAKLYQGACDHAYAKACSALGYFYKAGLGVSQDIDRAVVLCRRGCEGGDGMGCAVLASMYETGEGVPKDIAMAASFDQRGCDQGAPLSCSELGGMYFYGTGVARDEEKAVKLFQRACDGGATPGCRALGSAYEVGRGVLKDETVAATFFQRACDLNDSKACATLGAIYEHGTGVTIDIPRAIELYQKACSLPEIQGCDGVKRLESPTAQQQNRSPSKGVGSAGAGLEVLSDTEGVDFNSYLRDVYVSVKKHWFAIMPPSVVMGQQGANTVEFRILQDGNVPTDSMFIVSSGKSDFDAASLEAIKEAAPFKRLPELFSKPLIVLRFSFYYNLPVPQNSH
jgi:TonB family protein